MNATVQASPDEHRSDSIGSPGPLRWRAVGIILLYGCVTIGIHLGSGRVLSYHEAIFAQGAREMVATGDWLVPRFAGQPYMEKPPITYWLMAAAMTLTGSGAEWVCRLPGVLAGLAIAWIMAAVGARWYGERVGVLVGLAQLSSFYLLMQARLAESDIFLCLFVTAAMAVFARGVVDRPDGTQPPRWAPWAFYAMVGLAFLTKFLIGPAFIMTASLMYAAVQRDRRAARFLVSPVGWLILLAVVLPWSLVVGARVPGAGQVWMLHNFGRFIGAMDPIYESARPWTYYFYQMPAMILPWTPWFVAALVHGRRTHWSTNQWTLLTCWFLVGFVLLAANSWRAKHYLVPILPPLLVSAGWFLDRDSRERIVPRIPLRIESALVVFGTVAGIVVLWLVRSPYALAGTVVLVGVCACLVASFVFDYRRRPNAVVASLFGACAWAVLVTQFLVLPHTESYRPQTELATRINAAVPTDEPVYLVGLGLDQTVYYLRFPLLRADHSYVLAEQLAAAPPRDYYMLLRRKDRLILQPLGQVTELDRCSTVHKFRLADGPLMLIRLRTGN